MDIKLIKSVKFGLNRNQLPIRYRNIIKVQLSFIWSHFLKEENKIHTYTRVQYGTSSSCLFSLKAFWEENSEGGQKEWAWQARGKKIVHNLSETQLFIYDTISC